MASPHLHKRPTAPPDAGGAVGGNNRNTATGNGAVQNVDRIPLYVGAIIGLSFAALVGLHRMKFRMIVGAG